MSTFRNSAKVNNTEGPTSHLVLLAASVFLLLAVAHSTSTQVRTDQCAGINKDIHRKALEAIIEKYRKGEPVADGWFSCRKAFPVLKEHALDPDPRVRARMTFYLKQHYSREALQTLVRQIEAYPSDPSAFPVFYAAYYPCYFFRKIKIRSLTQALATRIKSRDDGVKLEEIRLLGCLAQKDVAARNLLEEVGRPSFPVRLSEQDAPAILRMVTYALAEAGVKEAEEKVLADIEAQSKTGDPDAIRSSLFDDLKQFTNCRILRRYAQFITDKRPGPKVKITNDFYDPRYKLESNLVQLRVGDVAIAHFASVFGPKFTGSAESDISESKAYTDEEMERIYQRVKKALESGEFSTCRSSKSSSALNKSPSQRRAFVTLFSRPNTRPDLCYSERIA